ncbi:MAG: cysteine hydrolase family protein [Verrucomicrobia bacterium]|nr:cysteine hydrolase family protein [Verrucomicrobiota bacterium]
MNTSMHKRLCILTLAVLSASAFAAPPVTQEPASDNLPNRPKVPGTLRLHLRERKETAPGNKEFKLVERTADWEVSKTAIIIVDMWDGHYCRLAAQRLGVIVPRMNTAVSAARSHGVQVIHAPSGVTYLYADMPYRKRMQQAPAAKMPADWNPKKWCDLDLSREPPVPVDTSKCSSDDPIVGAAVQQFTRQHPGLDMVGYDGVSDNAQEIFNFCEANGITNIVIMGVHTNMCILGRPFGIRAMVRLGRNVVLARDLTDAMYDPRQPPFVSHARGTEMVIEHIEKYWCPTILSDDLTKVVPGSAGP